MIYRKRKSSPPKNWEYIDKMYLKLHMSLRCYKVTVIAVYAPNEDNGGTVTDEFVPNLNEEIIKSGSGRNSKQ